MVYLDGIHIDMNHLKTGEVKYVFRLLLIQVLINKLLITVPLQPRYLDVSELISHCRFGWYIDCR
jgi:hypothetical protein